MCSILHDFLLVDTVTKVVGELTQWWVWKKTSGDKSGRYLDPFVVPPYDEIETNTDAPGESLMGMCLYEELYHWT